MRTNTLVLNRVFNKKTFSDLIQGSSNNTFTACINQYVDQDAAKNNYELIIQIYKYLSKHHRNEYFYKNTLLNKLVLGRHSINTTTAVAELPINNSIVDFVLINGTATVYEIKTELDTFERLQRQLQDYYSAFNKVYVLTSEKGVEKLKVELENTDVGIIVLTRRNTLSERKTAKENNNFLNHISIFKILRKKEYEYILFDFYGYLPKTTQVRYYSECLKMFLDIPIIKAHQYLINMLKERNLKEKEKFLKVPYELKYLAYFSDFKANDYIKLQNFLKNNEGRNQNVLSVP